MTSSNGNIFRVTGHLCREFTGSGEFPVQRPVTRSFDVFFDLPLNKRLSKQSWGWWFETLSRPLWCHCNVTVKFGRGLAVLPRDYAHDSVSSEFPSQSANNAENVFMFQIQIDMVKSNFPSVTLCNLNPVRKSKLCLSPALVDLLRNNTDYVIEECENVTSDTNSVQYIHWQDELSCYQICCHRCYRRLRYDNVRC